MSYYLRLVGYFATGAVISLPVLITFAETVGWVAEVEGKSMRVGDSLVPRPTIKPSLLVKFIRIFGLLCSRH